MWRKIDKDYGNWTNTEKGMKDKQSLIEILDVIDTYVREVQEEEKKNGAGKNIQRNKDCNVPKMMKNINLQIQENKLQVGNTQR